MREKLQRMLLALCIIIMLPGIDPGLGKALAADKSAVSEPTVTQIKGLKTSYKEAVSSKLVIKDSIKVNPVRNCKLQLQIYNSGTEKWETAKSFKLEAGSSGKIKLKYPSNWKREMDTRWRLYIPASEGYAQYISPEINIRSTRPLKPGLKLGSKSAVIIRASDGYVIYGKKKDKKLANASTTKMMTALLALERGGLNGDLKISKKAASTPYGILYASAGTKYRVKDLLNAMLICSSNDSASALAEHYGGSIKAFASLMTRRAVQLGCKNTNFKNPHGLDAGGHYSSAYDLARIQRECIKHPEYLDIISRSSYSFSSRSKPRMSYTVYSTDALLGSMSGFLGGKTGYTDDAGLCFCGVYKHKGVTYIYTVLGNPSSEGRWSDSRRLMNFIKKNYK